MKNIKTILAMLMLSTVLSACGGCTEEEAQEKMVELSQKLTGMLASDPQKMVELSGKLQSIGQDMQDDPDLDEVCAAMDDLMDELD